MKTLLSLATLASVALAATTNQCPAPGDTDSKGRYSCNPAHAYPDGQNCALVDGCYLLADCPAPGKTDSQGRYSCNPAHKYPEGKVCSRAGGCYFLSSQQ